MRSARAQSAKRVKSKEQKATRKEIPHETEP